MGTSRSLNKLEFKAHMSIHNKVAVLENETHEPHYTRDRFGKNHRIGNSRIRRIKKNLLMLAFLSAAHLLLDHALAMAQAGRNTNVRVESSSLDKSALDAKLNAPQDEKLTFYKEGSTSIGFNEDGDPNMSLRF